MKSKHKKAPKKVFDYLRLKEFCKQYASIITLPRLRWMLHKANRNGADYFVRRMGEKNLVISPTLFFEWVENNRRESD